MVNLWLVSILQTVGGMIRDRGIITLHLGGNMQVSLYPFQRKCGRHVVPVQVSDRSVARFTIIHQIAPLPSGLTAAVENGVIAVGISTLQMCSLLCCFSSCYYFHSENTARKLTN